MKKIIIAAISQNGVIGQGSCIPWSLKEEMNHFKRTTVGFPVIIGRNTFASLKKPLENRLNIVISSNSINTFQNKNVIFFPSIKLAYSYLEINKYSTVFIAGGERIYKITIRDADELILSFLKFKVNGDKYFPKINFKNWNLVKETEYKEFFVRHYVRRK